MASAARRNRSYSLEAPHEIRARVRFILLHRGRTGQQQPRLDLGQGRGHHEVFPGQLEPKLTHELHVLDVLPRDLREGNVQDVEIPAADEVEKEVERSFERLDEHLQRVGRDVEIRGAAR